MEKKSKTHYLLPLGLLLFLSTIDAMATAFGIELGVYSEQNPLMEVALNHSAETFLWVKTGIITTCCGILAHAWDHKSSRWAAAGGLGLYTGVILIHSYMLSAALIY